MYLRDKDIQFMPIVTSFHKSERGKTIFGNNRTVGWCCNVCCIYPVFHDQLENFHQGLFIHRHALEGLHSNRPVLPKSAIEISVKLKKKKKQILVVRSNGGGIKYRQRNACRFYRYFCANTSYSERRRR